MSKYLPLVAGCLLVACTAFGQEARPEKTTKQLIGIQANQLVRQILNFGGSSNSITNPYLLTYGFYSTTTGTGLSFGLGSQYSQAEDGDALTPRKTINSNFSFRVGLEKRSFWGKRWMASFAGDIIAQKSRLMTETTFNGGGPSSFTTKTENTTSGFGLGPRFTLNFVLTDRLMVGTEGSYYFVGGKVKTSNTNEPIRTNKARSFTLSTPAVIFLIFRF